MNSGAISNTKLLMSIFYATLIITMATAPGCAKTVQAFTIPREKIQSGSVRIYIFRPSLIGMAVSPNIYENNKLIGRIGPKAYLVWDTNPGDIIVQGGKDFIRIIAKPGKTYYIKMAPKFSYKPEAFNFSEVTSSEAETELSGMKPPKTKIIS